MSEVVVVIGAGSIGQAADDWLLAGHDESRLVCGDYRLRTIPGIQFHEDMADMGLRRLLSDEQLAANFGVRQTAGDKS
jgi:hypothetical protein